MVTTSKDCRFAELGSPLRIWTISDIYGDTNRLQSMHSVIEKHFNAGDKIIYFGNYTGGDIAYSSNNTISKLLCFRNSLPACSTNDVIYLRGIQEELWQKLLQLQFANKPTDILQWMSKHGIEQTLISYGGSLEDGYRAIREGTLSLTRWTNRLRQNMSKHIGHMDFRSLLHRAAFTETDTPLLFVHSGIDINKPITAQKDNFWWNGADFNEIDTTYDPFKYVIRGHDPEANGLHINGVTMSLDSNTPDLDFPAMTGSLLSGSGEVIDVFTA